MAVIRNAIVEVREISAQRTVLFTLQFQSPGIILKLWKRQQLELAASTEATLHFNVDVFLLALPCLFPVQDTTCGNPQRERRIDFLTEIAIVFEVRASYDNTRPRPFDTWHDLRAVIAATIEIQRALLYTNRRCFLRLDPR